MRILELVNTRTLRGGCVCGECDESSRPDLYPQPIGHTLDLVFFKVALLSPVTPAEVYAALGEVKSSTGLDLLDGKEHSYMEIADTLGNHGFALGLIGLGGLLGMWEVLTPHTRVPVPISLAKSMELAQIGFVTMLYVTSAPTGAVLH